MVEDVNQTVAFYCDVLGFELSTAFPSDGLFEWAIVRRGNVELLFHSRTALAVALPGAALPPSGPLTLYIDLDAPSEGLYHRVRQHAEVVHPPRKTCYGTREFSIRDNNGFVLTFADRTEELTQAA